MFLLREFLRSFVFSKKKRIGFVLCVLPSPYHGRIMASARLRAYDIINGFQNSPDYFLELYKPWKRYDIVIFQKKFDPQALALAKKLKKKKTTIILDINVNYYDKKAVGDHEPYQHDRILRFTNIADGIITSTEYIKNYARVLFPKKNIVCIPENITDNFFSAKKETRKDSADLKLLYVGYAAKANELYGIKKPIERLRKKCRFSLLLICDKDPKIRLRGIRTEFRKYRHRKIHRQMLDGDICIAPRDLKNTYNLGHSFTKIGYPMSVGIPVVASAIPSYSGSPAILCKNDADWQTSIGALLRDAQKRESIASEGISYCKKMFSSAIVLEKYRSFFETVLHQK